MCPLGGANPLPEQRATRGREVFCLWERRGGSSEGGLWWTNSRSDINMGRKGKNDTNGGSKTQRLCNNLLMRVSRSPSGSVLRGLFGGESKIGRWSPSLQKLDYRYMNQLGSKCVMKKNASHDDKFKFLYTLIKIIKIIRVCFISISF